MDHAPVLGKQESKKEAWKRCTGEDVPSVTITVAQAMAKCGLVLETGGLVPPGALASARTAQQTFAVLAGASEAAADPAGAEMEMEKASRAP